MKDGITQYALYPGIRTLLRNLQAAGSDLYIVSNKLTEPLTAILKHAGITGYFRDVVGIDGTGPVSRKQQEVAGLIERKFLKPGETVMVGDTDRDIQAGKENGLSTVGVLYGFGSTDELQSAGADEIAGSVRELASMLLPRP
jgi:phosphoglycolate phosphatase